MRYETNVIWVLLFVVAFSGCKKDDPAYSDIPEIEYVSISPSTAKEFTDNIVITISYKDGNGDLGENNAAAKNVFVTDSRNNVVYQLRIRQLGPDGADIAIKGKVNIELGTTGITNGTSSQSYTYSVYVTDRAENKSNTVTTGAVTVLK